LSQELNEASELLITLTADIVAAHVSNNSVAVSDISLLIKNVHSALSSVSETEEVLVPQEPAVPVRNSVKRDFIICLEDGMKLKMLKRHLMTHFNMTPDEYRAKWNLPADYPMVAPAYAETRRTLAKAIGLGRAPGSGRKKKVK
jgi:predicted transcriptional regulator